jgi:hypothetical protein
MRILTIAMVVAGVAVAAAGGQTPRPATADKDTPLYGAVDIPAKQLALRIGVDRERVSPGDRVTIIVAVTPRARMHVYAPGEPDYIPIELKLDRSPRVSSMTAAQYPGSNTIFLAAVNQRVKAYDAPFRITQALTIAATPEIIALAGSRKPVEVTGTLSYQACDDSVCYRPESVPLRWEIPITTAR